jgi:hypothetical protein
MLKVINKEGLLRLKIDNDRIISQLIEGLEGEKRAEWIINPYDTRSDSVLKILKFSAYTLTLGSLNAQSPNSAEISVFFHEGDIVLPNE